MKKTITLFLIVISLMVLQQAQAQTLTLQIPADLPALAGPWDTAIDEAGNIYVAAQHDRQIVKLSPTGEELMRVSLPGDGFPAGIDLDNEANIYVADVGNNCAHKFDSRGNLVTTFGAELLYSARGLAVDGSGHVYLGDRATNKVHVFTTSGEFRLTLEIEDGYFVDALAVDDADNLYVAGGGLRILIYNSSLNFLSSFGRGDLGVPDFATMGLDVNASGHIYLSNVISNEVLEFDSNGNLLNRFGDTGPAGGNFENPRGVAIDQTGNIYVTDYFQGRVQKFGPSGNFLLSYGTFGTSNGQFNAPRAVAVDHLGNIYVADLSHRIQKFNSEGNFLLSFTVSNSGYIKDIAVDSFGNIYVADLYVEGTSGISRTRKFDMDGNLISSIDVYAEAVTVDDMDNVYFLGPYGISKYNTEGDLLLSFNDMNYDFLQADIAVDGLGNIYAATATYVTNYLVLKYDSVGNLIDTVFETYARIDTDTEDNLYIADKFYGSISALDIDGNTLYSFGDIGGGPGELSEIEDIAVTLPGVIYIADGGNHRVVVFGCMGGDADGDGICDYIDECPEENSTGFDADQNGCIDSLNELPVVIDTLLDSEAIDERIANSLKQKLANAEKSVTKENICAAINLLEAFKNQVNAQTGDGKKISAEAAALIIEYTDNVIAVLISQLPLDESC